jgi:transcriptional regulator GlxA family with amidase domain
MKARDLLLHTDMPIKRVAKEVGLVDIQHLYKIFHSELGQTPGAVRAGEKCEGSPFASEVRYMAPTGPAL